METICIDTDILVDFLRNKGEAVQFIKENEIKNRFATTYINLFELYYGAMRSDNPAKNKEAVEKLQERLYIINLSEESVKKAGEVLALLESKGNIIEFRDLLIGTIALCRGFTLKTNNKKHFDRIIGLKLL